MFTVFRSVGQRSWRTMSYNGWHMYELDVKLQYNKNTYNNIFIYVLPWSKDMPCLFLVLVNQYSEECMWHQQKQSVTDRHADRQRQTDGWTNRQKRHKVIPMWRFASPGHKKWSHLHLHVHVYIFSIFWIKFIMSKNNFIRPKKIICVFLVTCWKKLGSVGQK